MKALKLFCITSALSLLLIGCNSEEKKAYQKALDKGSVEAIDSFLSIFPNSAYKEDILKKQEELCWKFASQENTVFGYKDYMNRFPDGSKVEAANKAITQMPLLDPLPTRWMSDSTFVGQLKLGPDPQLVAIKFKRIFPVADSLHFVANVNSVQMHQNVKGYIDIKKNVVYFAQNNDFSFIASPGRVYVRNNQIFMESTDLNQYWKVSF